MNTAGYPITAGQLDAVGPQASSGLAIHDAPRTKAPCAADVRHVLGPQPIASPAAVPHKDVDTAGAAVPGRGHPSTALKIRR